MVGTHSIQEDRLDQAPRACRGQATSPVRKELRLRHLAIAIRIDLAEGGRARCLRHLRELRFIFGAVDRSVAIAVDRAEARLHHALMVRAEFLEIYDAVAIGVLLGEMA